MSPLEPPLLAEMLATGRAAGDDGRTLEFHISEPYAAALQGCLAGRDVRQSIEIGLAYGVSALAILGAAPAASLISIDPFQQRDFDGRGRLAVEAAGCAERHELIEEPDYLALPRLVGDGHRVQFAYVDGWHTFDSTLLDFFFVDKMLDVGGVVGFNDCGMPAVHRVCGFVTSHRAYRELDVGLRPAYSGSSRVDVARRRRRKQQSQDRYFEKAGSAEPTWDFYAEF